MGTRILGRGTRDVANTNRPGSDLELQDVFWVLGFRVWGLGFRYWGYSGVLFGLYLDNGEYNGNYYRILGSYLRFTNASVL